MRACRRFDRNTNQVIRHLDHCMIKLMPDDSYRFIDNLKQDDKTLYAEWGLNVEHFRYLASTLGNNDAASKTLKSATCRMRPRKRLRGVADRRNQVG